MDVVGLAVLDCAVRPLRGGETRGNAEREERETKANKSTHDLGPDTYLIIGVSEGGRFWVDVDRVGYISSVRALEGDRLGEGGFTAMVCVPSVSMHAFRAQNVKLRESSQTRRSTHVRGPQML